MKILMTTFSGVCALILGATAVAAEFSTSVPMRTGNATTYYVKAVAGDLEAMEFMVDTGSGYTTINEVTLEELKRTKQAEYLRDLIGILANGAKMVVPVYRLASLNIGGGCHLSNIEAAVFPGKTRQILGLSALKQAGPFIFSFEPPRLMLSNCVNPALLASAPEK